MITNSLIGTLFMVSTLSADFTAIEHTVSHNLANELQASSQEKPLIILIGGFQGSGKSSLISKIRKTFDSNVISNDVIRQRLFDRGCHPNITSDFSTHVNSIFVELFQKALSLHTHIIIDANAHAKRLDSIDKLLHESSSMHTVVKILLTASDKTLRDRVRSRVPTPGSYQGTEIDLNGAFATITINPDDYDLVINTEITSEVDTFEQVRAFISTQSY